MRLYAPPNVLHAAIYSFNVDDDVNVDTDADVKIFVESFIAFSVAIGQRLMLKFKRLFSTKRFLANFFRKIAKFGLDTYFETILFNKYNYFNLH